MVDMLWKTYRAEVKSVDAEAGLIDMLIPVSTDSIDRDNEIIEAEAWRKTLPKFKKRPVLLSSHDYHDLRKQIGEFKKLKVDEGGLLAQPHYYIGEGNEEADWAFKLATKGMAAFSVGFIPIDFVDGDGGKEPKRIYKEVELLEISQVVIPSNRDAIQGIRAKSQDSIILELCNEVEKELATKPEETEDFIHVRVRNPDDFQKDSFRTIDIDKKRGIQAVVGRLKGDTTTTIQKYIFDKSKGWTMESAQRWVDEHSKETSKMELKGVISYQTAHPNGTPKDEGGDWDAGKEVIQAEIDDLKVMCAWIDSENSDNKTAYKLPHHRAAGEHAVVWRAVAAAGAVIMGARGGVDIPEDDVGGIKAHLAKHYEEFDRTPPWEKSVSQAQISDDIDYLTAAIRDKGLNEGNEAAAWQLVREIMGNRGSHIPLDIAKKIGTVLNQKNHERLDQIKSLAQEVLDSAEHEPEEPRQAELTIESVIEIVERQVVMAINKARGKIN